MERIELTGYLGDQPYVYTLQQPGVGIRDNWHIYINNDRKTCHGVICRHLKGHWMFISKSELLQIEEIQFLIDVVRGGGNLLSCE